ncbi:MAG: hypothetical protein ACREPR_00835, partial [Brasilonema sp.]
LKAELEEKDFFVVYFESSQDLELGVVDIADIMQAIACGFIRTVLRVDEYQTLIREYQTLVCLSEPYWDRSCGEY